MFNLKKERSRRFDFVVKTSVVATYTVDQAYVGTYELVGKPKETVKVLPAGYVVALNPATQKVVPHYATYGFSQVGVTIDDVMLGHSSDDYHDREIEVLWRGVVLEDYVWDDGDYGDVLQATKDALIERIDFVKESGLTRW